MSNVKDGATSLAATAPSPATSGTSITVTTGEGSLFPTPPFYAILHPANQLPLKSVSEKVLVTAVSTDTFTITRAQGGYSARTVAIGWRMSNAIFQDDFNNASIIKNEIPGGLVNGSNTAYTLASSVHVNGSLEVYKNGARLKGGGTDYTETTTGFTMATAPAGGAVLLVDYIVAGLTTNVGTNSMITDEIPTGLVNGSNTNYTTARAYVGGSLEVFINGMKQARGTHFTETSPSTGAFGIGDAPSTGDNVIVNYAYNLNPSSNADTVDGVHANTVPTANNLYPLDASALAVLPIRAQADTTDSTQNAKIQTGWGQILGNGTSSMTKTVTFPTPITTALSLTITFLGYKSGGTAATAITQFNTNIGGGSINIEPINITTTGFTASFASGGAFGAAYHGYSWILIGV